MLMEHSRGNGNPAGGSGRRLSRGALLLIILTLLAACAGFYTRWADASRNHPVPIYDEVAYLDLARDFKDRGSAVRVVEDYFQGTIQEDNRHPLFPLILSRAMRYQPEDFAEAKMANLAVGLVLLVGVALISSRLWGIEVGCLSGLFLSVSPVAVQLASRATADLLFAGLYFLSLAILWMSPRRRLAWLALGVTCALAYLTKGDGHLLLLPAFLVAWIRRKEARFLRSAALVLAGFALAASFLHCRNLLVFHSPLHNINAKVFWLDDWSQFYLLSSGPEWEKVGLLWYLSRHTFSQILLRCVRGALSVETSLLASMGAGPPGGSIITGSIMTVLAIYGLAANRHERRREQLVAMGSTGALFLILFAWYSQAAGEPMRFIFPVAISLLPFSAIGAITLYASIRDKLGKAPDIRRLILPAALLALVTAIILHSGALAASPRSFWSVPAEWQGPSRWIRENVRDERYLLDNGSFFSLWDCCRDRRAEYPFGVTADALKSHLTKNGIRFILLDQSLVKEDPYPEKYGPPDEHGPTTVIGWSRCYHDEATPSLFLVYAEKCP
jgi:dolichyl-phosphate-mannose-protein mannosyltransferase